MKNTQIKSKKEEIKLIIVTRSDISPGDQLAQSTHSVADFAVEHTEKFIQWKKESNSVVCLAVPNEKSLLKLYEKLKDRTEVSLFFEPDIDGYTSMAVYGTPQIRKKLSYLPLSLKAEKKKECDYYDHEKLIRYQGVCDECGMR